MQRITFLGDHEVTFKSPQLAELRDCNDALHDPKAIHNRIDADGYLLIRGLIDRQKVLDARRAILEHAQEIGSSPFKPGTELMDAVYNPDGNPGRAMGHQPVTHHPAVLNVLEGEELFGFFEAFFGEPTRTFDYKWLRFTPPTRAAGPHFDVVYMGRGSQRLHTCWVPFGDTPADMGTLAVLVGSHNLPAFQRVRDTYGKTDVDRDRTPGHFGKDPLAISEKYGGTWGTADFEAGDVIIFTMYTLHTSTRNMSDRWRISCDIRFQPAADPADERWVGKNPIAHSVKNPTKQEISFEEARKQWGV
jgi:hypothetical protein